jgi:F0F1-type ATP synthase assembly protein I
MQKKQPPNGSWAGLWTEALSAMSLGWELALPIFGGVLLGYALDRWLLTGHVFTLGLLGLGVFTGFYSLWRFHRRFEARERQAEEDEEKSQDP